MTIATLSCTVLGGVAAVTSVIPGAPAHTAHVLADGDDGLPTPPPATTDPCSLPVPLPGITCPNPNNPDTWGWG
ncbi:hypothetical protein [Actinacidiphila alni]|uniref:hypothetical protein n=1 Tax=Actinacidiphila alni TaxID=380248 RepID=UPI0015A5DC08|nr:hypothetical protein [Actinacidiphila alni]